MMILSNLTKILFSLLKTPYNLIANIHSMPWGAEYKSIVHCNNPGYFFILHGHNHFLTTNWLPLNISKKVEHYRSFLQHLKCAVFAFFSLKLYKCSCSSSNMFCYCSGMLQSVWLTASSTWRQTSGPSGWPCTNSSPTANPPRARWRSVLHPHTDIQPLTLAVCFKWLGW